MASSEATMADDESFELEDGELEVAAAVNGRRSSSSAADVFRRAQAQLGLDEATQDLSHQGQPTLARLARALVELDLRDAMWVLNDDVRGGDFSGAPALFDAFRRSVRQQLLFLQEAGYEDHEVSGVIPQVVVLVAQEAAAGHLRLDDDAAATEPYGGGGFGAVPAPAAAVRTLEKQTFFLRAAAGGSGGVPEGASCGGVTDTECSICFEEFVDGVQVSVMPCPSRRHRFHPDCIAKWLGISNMCPLCRHVLLPVYEQ